MSGTMLASDVQALLPGWQPCTEVLVLFVHKHGVFVGLGPLPLAGPLDYNANDTCCPGPCRLDSRTALTLLQGLGAELSTWLRDLGSPGKTLPKGSVPSQPGKAMARPWQGLPATCRTSFKDAAFRLGI